MINLRQWVKVAAWSAIAMSAESAFGATVVTASAGANPAAIQAAVDAYRASLGALNANTPGTVGSGRREINWDAAPDTVSDPNAFPGGFFNANFAPRARGAVFSTPGSGMLLSSKAASGQPVLFGSINAGYPAEFQVFSAERLFTAVDNSSVGLTGNIVDVKFFIPGTATPATTSGFGAVFVDVDQAASTSIEYFNAADVSLGVFFASPFDKGLSFLGVHFDAGEGVARVRINSGSSPINSLFPDISAGGNLDAVVMDDFIYGEPVPEPTTLTALLAGGLMLAARRRRA